MKRVTEWPYNCTKEELLTKLKKSLEKSKTELLAHTLRYDKAGAATQAKEKNKMDQPIEDYGWIKNEYEGTKSLGKKFI